MAISKINVPVTSTVNASSLTATAPNTMYQAVLSLDPAVYTVTCNSGTVANVVFLSSSNTVVTSATTTSGTVSVNLASAVNKIQVFTDTGTNIPVTITKIATALTDNFSGTLDTVTTTSTYTGTSTSGLGYAVVVGAGGGGQGGNGVPPGTVYGGQGGGSGGVGGKVVTLTGSMSVVIGAGGTAGTAGSGGYVGGAGGGGLILIEEYYY